jgi:hypothetical protein
LFLLSAVGLSGFGIGLTALTQLDRIGDPVVLFFTSVTLYLSEAVLFWMFFTGLWVLCGKFASRWIASGPVTLSLGDDPANVANQLRRFAFFQIAFVAVWSILFKGVLYTTLRASTSHYLLAKGQSLGIAIPAECIILLLILWGVVKWWLRAAGRVRSNVDGCVGCRASLSNRYIVCSKHAGTSVPRRGAGAERQPARDTST